MASEAHADAIVDALSRADTSDGHLEELLFNADTDTLKLAAGKLHGAYELTVWAAYVNAAVLTELGPYWRGRESLSVGELLRSAHVPADVKDRVVRLLDAAGYDTTGLH